MRLVTLTTKDDCVYASNMQENVRKALQKNMPCQVYCLSLGKITPQLLLYVNPFTPPCNFFLGNGNVVVALDYKILQLILLFKNKNEIELL